jgi:ribosomal silencing factor RsfS
MSEYNDITVSHNFHLDAVVDTLLSQKFTDIHVIDTSYDQYHDNVIICTATSSVQMKSTIKKIKEKLLVGEDLFYEGENSSWLLLSLKGILVQILLKNHEIITI